MTDKQEKRIGEIKKNFNFLQYDWGVRKAEESVDFLFEYGGEETIQCISASCSCTNPRVDEKSIQGSINIGSPPDKEGLYTNGEGFFNRQLIGNVWKYRNVETNEFHEKDAFTWVKVKSGYKIQTITVYFDDGEDFFLIDDKKVRRSNNNKLTVTLTVKGFVLLED